MKKLLTSLSTASLSLAVAVQAQAQSVADGDPTGLLNSVGDSTTLTGGGEDALATAVGNIINILLGLLGVIFLILVIISGFQWMTAGGDEGKVSTAKTRIQQAVIGLVITLAAYAISGFVIEAVQNALS
jgi:hypothetical protein